MEKLAVTLNPFDPEVPMYVAGTPAPTPAHPNPLDTTPRVIVSGGKTNMGRMKTKPVSSSVKDVYEAIKGYKGGPFFEKNPIDTPWNSGAFGLGKLQSGGWVSDPYNNPFQVIMRPMHNVYRGARHLDDNAWREGVKMRIVQPLSSIKDQEFFNKIIPGKHVLGRPILRRHYELGKVLSDKMGRRIVSEAAKLRTMLNDKTLDPEKRNQLLQKWTRLSSFFDKNYSYGELDLDSAVRGYSNVYNNNWAKAIAEAAKSKDPTGVNKLLTGMVASYDPNEAARKAAEDALSNNTLANMDPAALSNYAAASAPPASGAAGDKDMFDSTLGQILAAAVPGLLGFGAGGMMGGLGAAGGGYLGNWLAGNLVDNLGLQASGDDAWKYWLARLGMPLAGALLGGSVGTGVGHMFGGGRRDW